MIFSQGRTRGGPCWGSIAGLGYTGGDPCDPSHLCPCVCKGEHLVTCHLWWPLIPLLPDLLELLREPHPRTPHTPHGCPLPISCRALLLARLSWHMAGSRHMARTARQTQGGFLQLSEGSVPVLLRPVPGTRGSPDLCQPPAHQGLLPDPMCALTHHPPPLGSPTDLQLALHQQQNCLLNCGYKSL